MDAFYGMILQLAFGWEPLGWMFCHGQSMNINQNPALYSLLGTQFGGDGRTTFNLPDLRVKKADGTYYRHGDKMSNGLPFLESYICVGDGIYPQRP